MSASKSTSITIRFNNGEISEGLDAVKQFCAVILSEPQLAKNDDSVIIEFVESLKVRHLWNDFKAAREVKHDQL